jgi:hypothetical protein
MIDTIILYLHTNNAYILIHMIHMQEDIEEKCESDYPALTVDRRKAVELNNGRAAMMGILALMIHEKLDNNPYIINSLLGYPVAFNQ